MNNRILLNGKIITKEWVRIVSKVFLGDKQLGNDFFLNFVRVEHLASNVGLGYPLTSHDYHEFAEPHRLP